VATTRFEIAATMPEGSNPEKQLAEMMQALLTDRFQLKTHRESREFSVYALGVAAGGPALVRLPDDAASDAPVTVTSSGSGNGIAVDLGQGSSLTFMNNRFEANKVTMQTLAETLGRFVDRPVVDLTTLEGRYDVAFDVSSRRIHADADPIGRQRRRGAAAAGAAPARYRVGRVCA
jgi:uncharacterized protein (TIGR03435 family)